MKTVILCGGEGTRLRDYTDVPKPLVEVGGKPILIHLMELYSYFGFNDFILCLGYKGDVIKQHFIDSKWRNSDFTLENGNFSYRNEKKDIWKIAFVDTGKKATKAERLKRVEKLVRDDTSNNFFVAYGDDISNVNLKELLKFHEENGRIATLTTVQPINQYGIIEFNENNLNEVVKFREKPKMNQWINGGFYVFKTDIFDYMQEGEELEQEVVRRLIEKRQLIAYRHLGFWKSMNTFKDVQEMNEMWDSGSVPWKDLKDRIV